jgi:hypothetical protein
MPPQTNVQGVFVTGGASVKLKDIKVADAGGGASAHGIRCTYDADVTLERVVIEGNAGDGVTSSNGCTVAIFDSEILDNTGKGVRGSSGTQTSVMEVWRSIVRGNYGGGIMMSGKNFRIVNNIIVGNGADASGPTAGVFILAEPPGGISTLSFNTVADNVVGSAGNVGGLRCETDDFVVNAANNIVWGNAITQVSPDPGCGNTYSDIQGGATGTGNIDSNPIFVGGGDYHISFDSPCRDAAAPDASTSDDIDHEPRAEGLRADIGADEFWP